VEEVEVAVEEVEVAGVARERFIVD